MEKEEKEEEEEIDVEHDEEEKEEQMNVLAKEEEEEWGEEEADEDDDEQEGQLNTLTKEEEEEKNKKFMMMIVTLPPLERRLNWVPGTAPTPPRDHGKENHPLPPEPRKLPCKIRPRRGKREHHHKRLPGATGSVPGTSPPPKGRMSTPVKHPQLPQLPQPHQPPRPAANENSSRAHLPEQPDPSRLYKRAHSSISKDTTTRSRRDYFSGSNLPFTSFKRSHRDYFSGSPYRAINKKRVFDRPL